MNARDSRPCICVENQLSPHTLTGARGVRGKLMERHWTRPHSEASASRCEVRFPASSPYALACGGIAHRAAGSRHRWHRHSGLQRRLHLPEDRPQDSPLFWNYLTFSDGLLTVYEVAREFEFNFLRHAVWQVGDYRCRTTKSALLTKIILYATRGGPR